MKYSISASKACDILIIGGGGGGLVAAARAAFVSGKRVILLEKTNKTGGGARFASAIRTFGSKWQKDRGLPDTTHKFIVEGMDSTYWQLDHRLVANSIRATGEFFDWFIEVGDEVEDEFEVGYYIFDGPDGPQVPLLKGSRSHWGAGQLIMSTMLDLCEELGAEVLTEHRAVDVEVRDGKIGAVIAEGPEGYVHIECEACILATGSWINNPEVMDRIAPRFKEAKIDTDCAPHINPAYTGDGIKLAERAGAFLDYDSFCIRYMGPCMFGSSQVLNTMGASPYGVSVNLNGERWSCEPTQTRMGFFESGFALYRQPKSIAYIIFDENNLRAAIEDSNKAKEGDGGFFGNLGFPGTAEGVYADIEKSLRLNNGESFRADTLEELAGMIGVDPQALTATVARYNAACEAGEDWEFFKPADKLVSMDKPPYYAVRGLLGTDGAFGGVLVSPDMQAYRDGGGLVEGLYTVGDFASGRHISLGGVKVQVLNDASWAFASGFIAGNSAADYVSGRR